MAGQLLGNVAIVTGGSSGIGRATCMALARAGADVVAVGRNRTRLAETIGLVRDASRVGGVFEAHPRRFLEFALDVQSEADVEQLTRRTLDAFGRIDILVCAAGIVRPPGSRLQSVAQTSLTDFEAVLRTNLKGVFLCNRAVLAAMLRQESGDIVNISSTSGLVGMAFDGPYCASKFGLIGLSERLAEEAAPHGVRVQVIVPGPFETEMWARTPSGLRPGSRLPPGDRVAEAILYMLTLPPDTRLVAPVVQPLALELGSGVLGGAGASAAPRRQAEESGPAPNSTRTSTVLRGKVVVVIGAGSSLGQAICTAVAQQGASVVAADTSQELDGLVAELPPTPGGHLAHRIAGDGESDYQDLVQSVMARFRRLDALVTAARFSPTDSARPLTETSVAEWDAVMQANVRSVFLSNRAVLPVMIEQRGGVILNIASVLALKGRANAGPICAAHSAIAGLSQSIQDEVRSYGVKVQAVLPGTDHGGVFSPQHVADLVSFMLQQPGDAVLLSPAIVPVGARRRKVADRR
jgi:3-oxoacyl-[acyl-carrier protein] reductase